MRAGLPSACLAFDRDEAEFGDPVGQVAFSDEFQAHVTQGLSSIRP
jgi:hypothetical protein